MPTASLKKLFAACVLTLVIAWTACGKTIYVNDDAPPGGNGQKWTTAYRYIEDALHAAFYGDQIWVAAGVYRPDQGAGQTLNDRNATFALKNGVGIYGGFIGKENPGTFDLADRDFVANESMLTGEIGGASNTDNSYNVVFADGVDDSAVLDGFTVTRGCANGAWATTRGEGGGMYIGRNSSPTVAYCRFSNNSSANDGGGMFFDVDSSPTLTRCTFSGNSAPGGGGIFILASNATLTNCIFTGNSSTGNGGGIYDQAGNSMVINCAFSGNSASPSWGGGMYNTYNTLTAANCTFSDNSAARGAGMYNTHSSQTLINCTFGGNSATRGGGMYNDDCSPTLANCILWGDTDGEIWDYNSTPTVTYSDVQGGFTGTGNINQNPLFVNATAGDLHLQQASPCIDAGNNLHAALDVSDIDGDGITKEVIPVDLDGNGRFADDPKPDKGTFAFAGYPVIDMGAYEYPGREPIDGDLNYDGRVDLEDLAIMASRWLEGTIPE